MSSFEILEALAFVGALVLKDRKIIYANKAVEKILGWGATEVIGSPLNIIFSEPAFERFLEPLSQIEAGNFKALQSDILCRQKDDKDIYCLLSLASGPDGLIVLSLQDAANGSTKDSLTGLHTRKMFFVLAEHEIVMAKRVSRDVHLIFVDVDDLKPLNDSHGHAAGDELLRVVADILRESFRDSDVVARFGGDEFVVLALSEPAGEELMIQRIKALAEIRNREFSAKYGRSLSLSIGAVRYDVTRSLQFALDRADELMYEEKRRKKENKR
ncbi:diguanylate cyclase [Patescibacteria group bacterium]|nr:diguanylate cyclase [Patescibacteria group bacterium]